MIVKLKIPQIGFNSRELFRLCTANPNLHIERDEFEFIIIDTLSTLYYNSSLNLPINEWNHKKKLGRVIDYHGGFILPDSSLRCPEVSWISQERFSLASSTINDFIHACPDFVIELLSESDYLGELQEKMGKYIKNGVRLGWLIDKKNRQVHIYRPSQSPLIQSFNTKLSGEDVLVGFELDLTQIF